MSVVLDETVRRQVETEIRNIKHEFRGVIPEETIDATAQGSLDRLADSRVPQYVPLFVGRFTRERIRAMLGTESDPAAHRRQNS